MTYNVCVKCMREFNSGEVTNRCSICKISELDIETFDEREMNRLHNSKNNPYISKN